MTETKDKYTSGKKRIVVVDLDGTLTGENTFTCFVKWMWKVTGCRPTLPLIVLARKMRLISHAEAKRRVLIFAERHLSDADRDTFGTMLGRMVRCKMKLELSTNKYEGDLIVVATAAPLYYAGYIANTLPVDIVMATVPNPEGGPLTECRGEVKRERVEALCKEVGGEVVAFYTDHYDDLPLIEYTVRSGGEVILVSPGAKTLRMVKKPGISVKIL